MRPSKLCTFSIKICYDKVQKSQPLSRCLISLCSSLFDFNPIFIFFLTNHSMLSYIVVPGSHGGFSSLSLHYYSVNRPCHSFRAILTSRQQLSSLYVYLMQTHTLALDLQYICLQFFPTNCGQQEEKCIQKNV